MTGQTPAEREAIEAEDAAFFERNPGRVWRLRLAWPSERGAAVAVHWCGSRVAVTPAPAWTASDEQIERIVVDSLSPAAWAELEAAIARGRP